MAAIDNLEEAVKLDPDYGRAYAALALAYYALYVRKWGYVVNLSDRDAYRKTLEYLEQASRRPTVLYYQMDGLIFEDSNPAKALKRLTRRSRSMLAIR